MHGRPDSFAHGSGLAGLRPTAPELAERKSCDSDIASVPPQIRVTLLLRDVPTLLAPAPAYGVIAPVPGVRLVGPRWTTYHWPRQEISEKIPKEPSFPTTVR
jgi:hypothetical protein